MGYTDTVYANILPHTATETKALFPMIFMRRII